MDVGVIGIDDVLDALGETAENIQILGIGKTFLLNGIG